MAVSNHTLYGTLSPEVGGIEARDPDTDRISSGKLLFLHFLCL